MNIDSQKQKSPSTIHVVPELQTLLGQPVVFIDWPKGVKGTKRKWGNLTVQNMTPTFLAKLPDGNIGVALGEVSGGLCAIDLDIDDFIQPFVELNPILANTLQTHGSRGRVFWLRFTGDYPRKSSKLKDCACKEVGEFRSNGNQSIVWGIHPDTKEDYTFVVKQPVVRLDFASIRWPDAFSSRPTLQRDRESEVMLCSSVSPSLCPSVSPSLCLSVKSIEEAVEMSMPTQEHHNNAALFKLARALKAIESHTPLNMQDKLRAFSLWHDRASASRLLRQGLSRDDYFVEFLNAVRRAKVPLGESPAEQAWKLAQTEPFPKEAEEFTSHEGKLLVALCYQLHLLSEGKPWFVAARTAARLTGKTHTTAATWLSALVGMGILEVVVEHTTTEATRYRYHPRS